MRRVYQRPRAPREAGHIIVAEPPAIQFHELAPGHTVVSAMNSSVTLPETGAMGAKLYVCVTVRGLTPVPAAQP